MIAALYVSNRGPYINRQDVDAWTIERDATRYNGPDTVIAHPPCGHWGKYSAVCKQPGKHCGEIAIRQVRKFNGVVEHPLGSHLWRTCAITPGMHERDLWQGHSIIIDQFRFGFPSLKPTVLYAVGISFRPLPIARTTKPVPFENLTAGKRHLTPIALAEWLIDSINDTIKLSIA